MESRAPASEDAGGTGHSEISQRVTVVVAVLIAAEAAGALAAAGYLIVEAVTTTAESMAGALLLAGMAAALAALLAAGSAGALRHAPWVRGPLITWQLIQGGVAMRVASTASLWFGLPLLGCAVIIGVALAGPWVLRSRQQN